MKYNEIEIDFDKYIINENGTIFSKYWKREVVMVVTSIGKEGNGLMHTIIKDLCGGIYDTYPKRVTINHPLEYSSIF